VISREHKEEIVSVVKARVQGAQAVLVAENAGLTVAQMSRFRQDITDSGGGAHAQVIKNTLVRLALKGSNFEPLGETLSGPLIYGMGEDPAMLAKVFSRAAKENEKFIIRGGALTVGGVLSANDVNALAAIPGREQLLENLVGAMQAPSATFVRLLSAVPTGFVRALAAVRDKKLAQS
jgi:large subunit ribosomal protein L10